MNVMLHDQIEGDSKEKELKRKKREGVDVIVHQFH